jgi:hypothetical protein
MQPVQALRKPRHAPCASLEHTDKVALSAEAPSAGQPGSPKLIQLMISLLRS